MELATLALTLHAFSPSPLIWTCKKSPYFQLPGLPIAQISWEKDWLSLANKTRLQLKMYDIGNRTTSPLGPEQPKLPRLKPLPSFLDNSEKCTELLIDTINTRKLPPLHRSPRVSEFGLRWLFTLRSLTAAVCLGLAHMEVWKYIKAMIQDVEDIKHFTRLLINI